MAADVGSVSSISDVFRIYGSPGAQASRTSASGTGNAVGAVTYQEAGIVIAQGLEAAGEIVGHLANLASLQAQAANDGLVFGGVAPRVVLQAEARRELDRIDRAVASASYRGFSLVSSSAAALRIETRALGGSVFVPVQAMDVKGLGLQNLDLVSDGGVAVAGAAIAVARVQSSAGFTFLRNLDGAIPDLNGFILTLASSAVGNAPSAAPARGSIIDIAG